MKYDGIFAFLVFALVLAGCGAASAQTPGTHVTPIPLERLLNKSGELAAESGRDIVYADKFLEALKKKPAPVIIDVRSSYSFARAHFKGAINLSEPDLTDTAIKKYVRVLDQPILLYCDNSFFPTRMISLTDTAYLSLRAMGYTNVLVLGPLWSNGDKAEMLRPYIEGPEADILLSRGPHS